MKRLARCTVKEFLSMNPISTWVGALQQHPFGRRAQGSGPRAPRAWIPTAVRVTDTDA